MNKLDSAIVNILSTPILISDISGKIIFKNSSFETFFGKNINKISDIFNKKQISNKKENFEIIVNNTKFEVSSHKIDDNFFYEFSLKKRSTIFFNFVSYLLNTTNSLIFLISGDLNNFYYCNKAFEQYFGVSKQELKKDTNLFYGKLEDKNYITILKRKYSKNKIETDLKILNKDNKPRWMSLILYPFKDNKKNFYMGILNDIDKEKNNEIKLQETNFRFKNTMANLPESIWIAAVEKDIFYVNKTIEKIIGYSSDELTSKKQIIPLIHPDYKKLLLKKWEQLQKFGKLYDIEFLIKHKNGYYKWVKDTVFHGFKRDNITYYEGIIRDIDKEKKELLIKDVIYKITTAIYNSDDLYSLCRIIHYNMNRLFDTSNLFFALYDAQTNYFTVPYEMDQKDKFESFPADNTLSNYVLKSNKPVLLRLNQIKKMKASGEINYVGTEAKIWMGTPLVYKHKAIGVISLQDYENENHFNEEDLKTLDLLSYQIAQSIMFKITEQKLINSEKENNAILNVIPDMMFQMDNQGNFLSYRGKNFYLPPEQFLGKNVEEVLPPQLAKKIKSAIKETIKTNKIVKLEYSLAKNFINQFFEARIIKIDDNKILSIIRNITDSKNYTIQIEKTLKEKDLLLKEIHHRVKNNMQIISSLLNIQINNNAIKESNEIIREVQSRIRSMSLVHEKLYENDDFSSINLSSYINTLAVQLISMFSDDCPGIKLNTDIIEFNFDLNISIPLGLLINEIILLLLKHKIFKNNIDRRLTISLSDVGNNYVLSIRNNGKSLEDFNSSSNINYRIINILVYQLDGKLEYNKENENEIKVTFRI